MIDQKLKITMFCFNITNTYDISVFFDTFNELIAFGNIYENQGILKMKSQLAIIIIVHVLMIAHFTVM